MKKRSVKRALAAFLAMGLLFAAPAAAYAEELEIGGVEAEALTEETGEEIFAEEASSFDDAVLPASDEGDFFAENEEEAFVSDEDAEAPEDEDVQTADEVTDAAEDLIEDELPAEDLFAEEAADETLLFEESDEESLAEDALGKQAVPEFIPEITEEVTSEPVNEEALGALIPAFDGITEGKYGAMPVPTPFTLDNAASLDGAKVVKDLQNRIGTPSAIKSYKIVQTIGENRNVAKISKKGVITAKNPGYILVCAYDAKKEPVCCFIVQVSIYRKKAGTLTHKYSGDTSLFEFVEVAQPDGSIDDMSEYGGYIAKRFTYKSSNKKILSVDEAGKMTTGKNGTATITLKFSDVGKGSLKEWYIPDCKIKVKVKVKVASLPDMVSVKAGKTKTITVKGCSAENKVEDASLLRFGPGLEIVGQSGKYNEKIKVKVSADGGMDMLVVKLENGDVIGPLVYSKALPKKERTFADAGKKGFYDTKTAEKILKAVNAQRKKTGASSLKTHALAVEWAALNARGLELEGTRTEFDSVEALLGGPFPDELYIPECKVCGIAVFYDTEAKKYYLAVKRF